MSIFEMPLKITWNLDGENQPVSLKMSPENQMVLNGTIILDQIPDKFYKVKIIGMTEINDFTTQLGLEEFRVNYQTGIVFFNSSKEGSQVNVSEYYGRGIIKYPASRIYYQKNGVEKVLTEAIEAAEIALQAMGEVEVLTETKKTEITNHTNTLISEKTVEIENLTTAKKGSLDDHTELKKTELDEHTAQKKIVLNSHTDLKKTDLDSYIGEDVSPAAGTKKKEISDYTAATKIALDDSIATAEATKVGLNESAGIANISKTELDASIDVAGATGINMITAMELAQGVVDDLKDPVTGAIQEAASAKQNLDDTIVLADTKNTALINSMNATEESRTATEATKVEADNAKANLKATIADAETAKLNLDDPINGTIKKAEDIEDALSNAATGTIKEAVDANALLTNTTTTANSSKTTLDEAIISANNSKVDLDASKDAADALKGSLDSAIATSNTSKNNLNDAIAGAETAEGNLVNPTTGAIKLSETAKNNLDNSIIAGATERNALDSAIDTAGASAIGLIESMTMAEGVVDDLKDPTTGAITIAENLKGELDSSISVGVATKNSLDTSNNLASTRKSELELATSNATTANGALNTTISQAGTAQTNLQDKINEAGSVASSILDANSYTDQKISEIVGGASTTLDTLNELAAALGNDANFSTTISTQLGEKASTTDLNAHKDDIVKHIAGAERSAWNSYATSKLNASEYTAANILAKFKTVDGSGSGVDADTVDGLHFRENGAILEVSSDGVIWTPISMTAADILTKLKTVDSNASGLNANTLQGATLTDIQNGNTATATKLATARKIVLTGGASGEFDFDGAANATVDVVVADNLHNHSIENITGLQEYINSNSGTLTPGEILTALKTVDGAGSGLDADTLGGKSSSSFAPSGFGLGGTAKVYSYNPLNQLEKTGFYHGISMGNAPSSSWLAVQVISSSSSRCIQIAYSLTSNLIWMRRRTSSNWAGWSEWKKIPLEGAIDANTIGGLHFRETAGALEMSSDGTTWVPTSVATNMTADDILTLLKTVDLDNSGLNATTLQGVTLADIRGGNVATATALEAARTIELSGEVAGSGTFDGTGNLNIATTIQGSYLPLGGGTITGSLTVEGQINGRTPSEDAVKLDGIEANATADQTADEILTLLKTVHGVNSGLDAATVSGKSASDFAPSGYGLGGYATMKSYVDANTLDKTGYYQGLTLLNSPEPGWMALEVIGLNSDTVVQIITSLTNDNRWMRRKIGGSWNQWIKISTGDGDTKYKLSMGIGSKAVTENTNKVLLEPVDMQGNPVEGYNPMMDVMMVSLNGIAQAPKIDYDVVELESKYYIQKKIGSYTTVDPEIVGDTADVISYSVWVNKRVFGPTDLVHGSTIEPATITGEKLDSALSAKIDDIATLGARTSTLENAGYLKKSGDSMSGMLTMDGGFIQVGSAAGVSRKFRYDGTISEGHSGAYGPYHKIWHDGNDGSGSGLDADLLDGIQASDFVRKGQENAGGLTTFVDYGSGNISDGPSAGLQILQGGLAGDAFMTFHISNDFACYFGLDRATNDLAVGGRSMGNVKHKIYHSGNIGNWHKDDVDPTGDTRLNYDGNLYATKVYNAVYNDLAEYMYFAEEGLEAGDVLSFNKDGKLVKSNKLADKRVAGVYSDTYGYALGSEESEKKVPVGMSGRVWVKYTGDIQHGDLLIASDIPGVACICENPRMGTVIGKAAEDSSPGKDRICMLIMNA